MKAVKVEMPPNKYDFYAKSAYVIEPTDLSDLVVEGWDSGNIGEACFLYGVPHVAFVYLHLTDTAYSEMRKHCQDDVTQMYCKYLVPEDALKKEVLRRQLMRTK